jgi:hypothetical protein
MSGVMEGRIEGRGGGSAWFAREITSCRHHPPRQSVPALRAQCGVSVHRLARHAGRRGDRARPPAVPAGVDDGVSQQLSCRGTLVVGAPDGVAGLP